LYEAYAERVFRAQEKRYSDSGVLTAFGEGAYPAPYNYVYEWVVTGNGETWRIRAVNGDWVNGSAVIYTKIAFAFHAIWRNDYTMTLVSHVSKLQTSEGFFDGIMDKDGSNLAVLSDKTNGMVLEAAGYALQGPIPEFSMPIAIMMIVLALSILALRKLKRRVVRAPSAVGSSPTDART